MVVEDSMEGENGIEESWLFTSKGLRGAAGVAIYLGNIRPAGSDNGEGLVASGPVSFAGIYSKLNEVLRRGGIFKNGAVTLYLDYDHPDCEDFLNLTASDLPWAKRAIYVDENFLAHPILPLVIQKMNEGVVWLSKKRWAADGRRLYSQVCMEIAFDSRSTCLLAHVNMGQCSPEDLPSAFVEGMNLLCNIHPNTGVGDTGIYLSPDKDKQVGLGVLGLANFLAIQKVTYLDFVSTLEEYLDRVEEKGFYSTADLIVEYLIEAFDASAKVARQHGMERAFTIAPTATSAYKHRDADGYTTAPEISAPVANPITKEVDRDSGTFGVIRYQFHLDTETTSDIPWELQYRLMIAWQRLMDSTGLAHAISFNIWDKATIDEEFVKSFMSSPLWTTYYRLKTDMSALDKSTVLTVKLEERDDEKTNEVCLISNPGCSACDG